jgi:chromosome segregation ATPase
MIVAKLCVYFAKFKECLNRVFSFFYREDLYLFICLVSWIVCIVNIVGNILESLTLKSISKSESLEKEIERLVYEIDKEKERMASIENQFNTDLQLEREKYCNLFYDLVKEFERTSGPLVEIDSEIKHQEMTVVKLTQDLSTLTLSYENLCEDCNFTMGELKENELGLYMEKEKLEQANQEIENSAGALQLKMDIAEEVLSELSKLEVEKQTIESEYRLQQEQTEHLKKTLAFYMRGVRINKKKYGYF